MGTPIWFALGLLYALFCSLVDRGPNLTDDRREAQDEDWMWDELLEARERDEARVREGLRLPGDSSIDTGMEWA